MSINSTWAISSFVVSPRIDEEVTSRTSYACAQIGVDNRDYHYLSQNETLPGSKPLIVRESCENVEKVGLPPYWASESLKRNSTDGRKQLIEMVGLGRVELPTKRLGTACSIHLSYSPQDNRLLRFYYNRPPTGISALISAHLMP